MKKLTLSTSLLFGILLLSIVSCKKSENTDMLTKNVENTLNQKFPTLYNLSTIDMDSLKALLTSPNEKYTEALIYANKLAANHSIEKKYRTTSEKLSVNNLSSVNTTAVVNETSSVTTSNSSMVYTPNITSFDGFGQDLTLSFLRADVPKFTILHKKSVRLSGRNTLISVEVPILYHLSFDQLTGHSCYKIIYNNGGKTPKMYLSGVVGELHTEEESMGVSNTRGGGDWTLNAKVKIRETRAIVTTTSGSSISVTIAGLTIGGASSNGQTIQQIRNVQGYFDYTGNILFFGGDTGYTGTSGAYQTQMERYPFNIYQLKTPVIGTGDQFTFTGINQN